MSKVKCCILFIISSTILFAQNYPGFNNASSQELKEEYEHLSRDTTINSIQQFSKKSNLLVEGGINVSSFQNIISERRFGYSIGLTYSYNFNNSIGIDISGLVSRQNILVKARETASLSGEFVHRIIYDTKISLLFLELPVMINFKIWNIGSTSCFIGLGLGYSISFKDYSRNENFVVADEIIDIPPPVDEYYIEDSVFDNSGKNINAGIWFKHNRILVKFLYMNRRYDLKRIDRAHIFSIHFGYHLN